MFADILTITDGFVLLVFGICMSASFAEIKPNKKNILINTAVCAVIGLLQLAVYTGTSETATRQLYPLITHLPYIVFLNLLYCKRISTACASVFTSYLFCQPAMWFADLIREICNWDILVYSVHILSLILSAVLLLKFTSPYISQLYAKSNRDISIFGIIPAVYYFFDYFTAVYSNFWHENNHIIVEFLPFLLCIAFTVFCMVYYKEHEQKLAAKTQEELIRITVEQQSKEILATRRSEQEIRMLRHDMHMLLNTVILSIDEGNIQKARQLLSSYSSLIEGTRTKRFCSSDIINYLLSHFESQCESAGIPFYYTIEIGEITVDEIKICSIISNALENALNAQAELPQERKYIKLMLKNSDGKILISVKNETAVTPIFSDGLPVTERSGHGFGTRSIRYMAESLGGNCQFTFRNGVFITRVIL